MKEVLWFILWAVLCVVTMILWCVFRPFVAFNRWREERKPRYGTVFKSFQEAIIVLELEALDRSAWGEEPSDRVIRHCPRCKVFHDGKNYCTLKCELGGKLCGFLKKVTGR